MAHLGPDEYGAPYPGAGTHPAAPPPGTEVGAALPAPGPGGEPYVSSVTGFRVLDAALDKAVAIPSASIRAHVAKLRARNPHASPQQIVTLLEREYLLAVSASGGAVGAAAAAPAVGTGVAMTLTASEVATFFAASAAFALAVAEVHGIEVEDVARRRTLVLATVLGDQGARVVGAEAGLAGMGGAWAKQVLTRMPSTTVRRVNTALTRRMVKRQAAKHGALAFGRLVPFGVGAAIGVAGARSLGRTVIEGARRAFGPPPPRFPVTVELTPDGEVHVAKDLDRLPSRLRRTHQPRRPGRRSPR